MTEEGYKLCVPLAILVCLKIQMTQEGDMRIFITEYEGAHICEGNYPVKSTTSKILTEKFMHN
jgi:hypothetical protein